MKNHLKKKERQLAIKRNKRKLPLKKNKRDLRLPLRENQRPKLRKKRKSLKRKRRKSLKRKKRSPLRKSLRSKKRNLDLRVVILKARVNLMVKTQIELLKNLRTKLIAYKFKTTCNLCFQRTINTDLTLWLQDLLDQSHYLHDLRHQLHLLCQS